MERYVPFAVDEVYHVYNRGIDKRKIFFSKGDWEHFQKLLFIRNATIHIKPNRVDKTLFADIQKGDPLVDIFAYAMMPNHFHLLLRERKNGGISKFMSKLLTAFALYMNKKYDRSGPLMCRPFRAKHVDDDIYLRWLISYIHLNPLELCESEVDWKESGIKNRKTAENFLTDYKYSSFAEYQRRGGDAHRAERFILNLDELPFSLDSVENPFDTLKSWGKCPERLSGHLE